MANPTSNFGWQMPTPTDLVTDLPADFEVFGQAVDTSLADLKGGTSGQILAKNSNTDMDFVWTTPNPGDITAVTAGTGLTGGGTSGDVSLAIDSTVATLTGTQTLTNKTLTSPALTTPTISTLTTNGDTIYGTGSGAISRLAIGTTGQVLTVSGGVPAWATPASGSTFSGFWGYYTGTLTVAHDTLTAVPMDAELYDTDNFHSTSTNNTRMTIPTGKGGKYLVQCGIYYEGYNGWANSEIRLYKNGSAITSFYNFANGTTGGAFTMMFNQTISVAQGDYLEFYVRQRTGVSRAFYMGTTEGAVQLTYLGA